MKGKIVIGLWFVLGIVTLIYGFQNRRTDTVATPQQKVLQVLVKQKPLQPKVTEQPPQQERAATIDLAFCLDTTGSMSELIEGAKQKIWRIVNTVAAGKPKPNLRIGLVAYRDLGDAYVTKVFDFTQDLDLMYSQLHQLRAEGGGDGPEHVNRALHEAVNLLKWRNDSETLKLVYLVGDAPPHMDYQDSYDYRKISRKATASGILINTVQCGESQDTLQVWQEIAQLAEGKYIQLDQSGGMIAINSPYDEDLARLSAELSTTYVPFGRDGAGNKLMQDKNDEEVRSLGYVAAAERAESKSNHLYKNEKWDLVDAVAAEEPVQLESLPPSSLPENLRGKSTEEQLSYVKEQGQRRQEIQKDINELAKKRESYIDTEKKKMGSKSKNAFDEQVIETLKEQGKEKGIEIVDKE